MDDQTSAVLSSRISDENLQKLLKIENPEVHLFIARYIELCNPETVFICSNSSEDIDYIRQSAVTNGEEIQLAIEGHTVHFDSAGDQGRDKKNTCILVPEGVNLGQDIVTKDRKEGLAEINDVLSGIMTGREMYVRFACLGPANSDFSIACVQISDSSYVAHSEDLLYRQGYEEIIRQGVSARFLKFVHSQGEIDENKASKNLDKRRIYIDINDDTVYSTNTQYGGNTIGLKKLAMRLAIKRASTEGWLTEHMLIMGIHGPEGRETYFTGAYPSLCGKTSTAMLDGETIVGDDIAYLKKRGDEVRAVNVEKGLFGIIQGINSTDDPIQWEALNNPGEVIFSNVLVADDKSTFWIGKDGETPTEGINFAGCWVEGMKDANEKPIPVSHPNARFTLSIDALPNCSTAYNDPDGVVISGIVYGGRDSDTCPPVEQSLDWIHGIITKGASLESETTAATLGTEGVRVFNPMSNLDFLPVPIGQYIQMNLDFGQGLNNPPCIFSVNYFLKGADGQFLNQKNDKKIWFKWMELLVCGDVTAIETPTGRIPKYSDLKDLFLTVLNHQYSQHEYNKQFMTRVPKNLAKIDRIRQIYQTQVLDTPEVLFQVLEEQERRLIEAREQLSDYIMPSQYGS